MLHIQRHCPALLLAAGVLFATTVCAQENSPGKFIVVTESAYLKVMPGYVGDELGATITDVTIDENEELQIIEIDVPIDPAKVDRVQLIGRSGKRIPVDRTTEILRDYENNNVGLKIYIPKNKNWVLKLRMIDEQNGNAN